MGGWATDRQACCYGKRLDSMYARLWAGTMDASSVLYAFVVFLDESSASFSFY